MDSMRSLNTSLPSASPSNRHPPGHSQEVMQAFKAAALSVTNLYKTAISDQSEAHQQGYQEAIEDLLNFLDKENLGLGDGEGWRVRQWATEQMQGQPAATNNSDTDEDVAEDTRARSSSPIMQRKPSRELLQETLQPNTHLRNASPMRPESAPPTAPEPHRHFNETTLPAGDFTFRASHNMPPTHDMDVDDNTTNSTNSSANSKPSVRIEVKPRRSTRNNNNSQRSNGRPSQNSLGPLGPGAGSKRRIPLNDLFDIGGFTGFGGGKDAFGGGGKRSRFT